MADGQTWTHPEFVGKRYLFLVCALSRGLGGLDLNGDVADDPVDPDLVAPLGVGVRGSTPRKRPAARQLAGRQ
jgi:hypothetical protein